MISVQHNVDLTALNTLALKSQSSDYIALKDITLLEQVIAYAREQGRHIFVLSGGSNVLLPERIDALTLHMQNKGKEIIAESELDTVIKVQAGEIWHDFVGYCCEHGLHGLENLALIPGYVGAAPIQNIGAYGVEVGELIDQIWVYDLQEEKHLVLNAVDCDFSYRNSIFKQRAGRYIIYAVSFRLLKKAKLKLNYADVAERVGADPSAQKLFETIIAIRQQKLPQPSEYPNAGSFFKNPILNQDTFLHLQQRFPQIPHYPQPNNHYKVAAGWLLEQAGWKGKKLGAVGMFERQALVLVNYGQATLSDVKYTYQQIQNDIQQKFAIALEPEPVLLNSMGHITPHQTFG